jgi:hypothetical protein
MDVDPITEAGKHLYGSFARISDPTHLDRRWSNLKPKVREYFINEARAAITVFLQITGR